MDKRMWFFFLLFGLAMIGGSLVVSLWVLPQLPIPEGKDAIRNHIDGIGKRPAAEGPSHGDHGPRKKKKVNMVLVLAQWAVFLGTIGILIYVGVRLKRRFEPEKPINVGEYLFKISRLMGKSEYDIFFKAAESWPVSKDQVEFDFKRYVSDGHIPYYVNDFVRKSKKHVDELPISIFTRRRYKDE
jgi:hypothetical protein